MILVDDGLVVLRNVGPGGEDLKFVPRCSKSASPCQHVEPESVWARVFSCFIGCRYLRVAARCLCGIESAI